MHSLAGLAISFVVLCVIFKLLELTVPRARRLPLIRQGLWTDIIYWIFTPLVTRAVTRVAVIIAIVPVAWLLYGRIDKETIVSGWGPLSRLPLGVQAAAMLVIGDFIGYWAHRAFHGQRLWSFHAVHHASTELDWLSSVRLHPVNDAAMRIASAVPLLALGFSPVALAGLAPVLTLFAVLLHANLDWDWGPLRSVIASPRFHRWHHTDEAEARDKNFAGFLPLWDILFGTYYMPRARLPSRFGTMTPVPDGVLSQLVFPFRRRSKDAATPVTGAASRTTQAP